MSMQRVCDGCGETIDTNEPFWTVSGVQQQEDTSIEESGPLPTMPMQSNATFQLDFHEQHLPEGLKPE